MSGRATLTRDLEQLVARTRKAVRRARLRRGLPEAARRALPWLAAVPFALLGCALLGADVGVPLALVLTLGLALAALALALVRVATRGLSRRDALGVVDDRLELSDRLRTADEFLRAPVRNPFMEAAIDDAARLTHGVLGVELHFEQRPLRQPWALAPLWLAGLALLALVGRGASATDPPPSVSDDALVATRPPVVPAEPREEALRMPAPEPDAPEAPSARPALQRRDEEARAREHAAELSDIEKESAGKTSDGRSSDARSTSGASEARGAPSNQGQVSTPSEKEAKPPAKKPAPKPEQERKPDPKPEPEDTSGSTAGMGGSKGSNKNSVTSDWSSKDQVATPDEEELEQDEDTEDEDEEQESRGGVQPALRDRRPPVSRDLRIGFGNRPNPDANGRGGPSEAKKSRGVASLVLGVPIPDRIKGQPNPGKTKVTQERIRPRPEEAATIRAEARRARAGSAGSLGVPELEPWMRSLVRSYFLALRTKNSAGNP
jgi:hypothetical protein